MIFIFHNEFQSTTKAKRILNSLSENLKLSDAHYFGLKTLDCQGHWHWINPQKSIQPQLKQWKCQPAIEQSFQPSSNGMKSSVSNGVVDFQDRVKKPASSFRVCGLNRSRQFHPLGSSVTESQAQSTTTTNHTQPLTLTYHIYFAVRYYPFDPTLISNEQTRYQIFLQLRADLVTGQLTVDQELFVSLCGLILQSDCGDYGEERLGPFYVKQLLKMPNLSPDVEARIKAKHAEFRCRQPALVEYQLLDRVKSCVSYGQNKFSVREVVSGMHCFLGIGPIALVIEDSQLNSIRFSWFQVSGLSRKNKQLLVNITDGAEKFCYRYSFEDQQWLQEKCKLCKDYFTFYKAELTRAFCQRSMDGGALPTNGHSPSTQITQCTNIPVSSLTSLGYQSRPDMQSRANSQEFAAQQPISRYTIESEMCYSQYPHAIASPTHEPQAYHLVRQIPEASVDYCSPPLPAIPVHCSAPMSTQQNWTGGRAQSNGEWPPNPYHVPPAGVFYRPRGCQTMTEFNDGQR
ncbi:putative 4.1 G protein [Fasciola hepatica]|uniref:4.1 G protein n=1 Tax=Fasciola hepatica TaxID=6192 RepID=A0A4E0RA10_FASHE|nr:putative 4.1 G protein [Fasciola hepatica]